MKAMPEGYEYSLAFYRRFYRPGKRGAAGGRRHRPAGDVPIDREVLRLVGRRATSRRRSRPSRRKPRRVRPQITFPGRTLPILVVAYKGDAFDPANRDYVAARLLGELAFGPQSELYKKLVLREQRVEMLHCEIPINRDQPLFEIIGDGQEGRRRGRRSRRNLSHAWRSSRPSRSIAQKLDELKRRDRYAFLMDLDTPDKVAGELARFVAVDGGIEAVEQIVRRVRGGHSARHHARGRQVFRARASHGGGVEAEGRERDEEGGRRRAERESPVAARRTSPPLLKEEPAASGISRHSV